MREIKFRLWCVNKSEWEKDAWFISPDGVVFDMKRFIPMVTGTHILEQYTGVMDKNGVKIFEGDTFEDEDAEIPGGYLVVVWNIEKARFQIDVTGYAMYLNEGGSEEYCRELSLVDQNIFNFECVSDLEILGNIHEKEK